MVACRGLRSHCPPAGMVTQPVLSLCWVIDIIVALEGFWGQAWRVLVAGVFEVMWYCFRDTFVNLSVRKELCSFWIIRIIKYSEYST